MAAPSDHLINYTDPFVNSLELFLLIIFISNSNLKDKRKDYEIRYSCTFSMTIPPLSVLCVQ